MILGFLVYVVVHNTKKRKRSFATMLVDLEGILSEIIQTKTNTLLITYLWNLKNKKNEYDKQI